MVIYKKLFQKTGLSIERLHSFLLVAHMQGFSKAAGNSIYKQSQYSRQIRELEEYFGFALFIRKGRSISLTKEGSSLKQLLFPFFTGLESLTSLHQSTKIDLRISAGESVIDFFFPSLLNEQIFKSIQKISFCNRRSEEAIEDLQNYSSDLAIISRDPKQKDLYAKKIFSSSAVMIFPKKEKFKLYVGDEKRLLANNPTIMLAGEGSFSAQVLRSFGKTAPNIMMEAPSFTMLKAYVAKGLGVSYIPSYCLTENDKQSIGFCNPKQLSNITRDLFLICRKNVLKNSESLQSIITSLTKSASAL